jgi:formylglycine-generating enzyme required for sulfatase activity
MKALLDNLKTNFLDKLPPRISETLKESIEQSERNEFTQSLRTLSESVIDLLRDEYYIPSGLVWNNGMGVVEMIRELRNAGKDLGKSETDAILRIQEKAKLDEIDSVVLESCFQGALEVFESFLLEKGNRVKKKVAATERKSAGRVILREIDTLLEESDTEEKIQEHFSKLEIIYRDFPYDKDVKKIYYQFLSHVDTERAKKEILGYLESGDVTIHLGAVCITLLAEMGFLYDAMKKLDWYDEEYHDEKDRIYSELLVFMLSYLMEGKNRDKETAEGLSDIIGQRKEPYYTYIENCYMILSEREQDIRQKSVGLYLFKENQFRMKCSMRKEEDKKIITKKPEVSKKVEPIQIKDRNNEPPIVESSSSNSPKKTITNSIGIKFQYIPEGEFMMGLSPGDSNGWEDEKPSHRVEISHPFYIGRYPVTQEEWTRVMGDKPFYFQNAGRTAPAEYISWNRVQEFLKKLNEMESRDGSRGKLKYRLPTEAEWEYGARAGTTSELYIGKLEKNGYFESKPLDRIGWFAGNSIATYEGARETDEIAKNKEWEYYKDAPHKKIGPQPVGKKEPNPWGLYDTIGNVWEWCEDWFSEDYYGKSEIIDPKGPNNGEKKVVRGGSWRSNARRCRVSRRNGNAPDLEYDYYGFRLLLPLS